MYKSLVVLFYFCFLNIIVIIIMRAITILHKDILHTSDAKGGIDWLIGSYAASLNYFHFFFYNLNDFSYIFLLTFLFLLFSFECCNYSREVFSDDDWIKIFCYFFFICSSLYKCYSFNLGRLLCARPLGNNLKLKNSSR